MLWVASLRNGPFSRCFVEFTGAPKPGKKLFAFPCASPRCPGHVRECLDGLPVPVETCTVYTLTSVSPGGRVAHFDAGPSLASLEVPADPADVAALERMLQ